MLTGTHVLEDSGVFGARTWFIQKLICSFRSWSKV